MKAETEKSTPIWKVITASSLGTLIEWYDFYIFGSLATVISKQFFPENQGTAALLSTLAIFAAGFIVRPFGALFFGRLGDLLGRKFTFLLTLVLMGGSTFAIGLVPGYKAIGWAAPLLVLLLRLVQGLALGGEYGGAATYVAEHAPPGQRGFYTSFIQTTATLGLFLSLGIILFTRKTLGVEAFAEWGWRIPFWLSIVLVGVSVYIRLKMKESPLFAKIKREGTISTNPLRESFSHKLNLKMVLLALFGAVMGQGVIWYTGQFYAQSFIENTCKVAFEQSRTILLYAIAFATPFFVIFGALSDRFGRKWIMMAGMLLGIVCYRSIYQQFLDDTNPNYRLIANIERPVCSTPAYRGSLDYNSSVLTLITKTDSTYRDGSVFSYQQIDTLYLNKKANFSLKGDWIANVYPIDSSSKNPNYKNVMLNVTSSVYLDNIKWETELGYVRRAQKQITIVEKNMGRSIFWKMVWLVFIQIIFVTMVYGPIAAFLVELFPTRIRYTSMSLPYHIGNGVFGGLVPFLSTLIIEYTKTPQLPGGSPLAGLWYPIGVAGVCFVIGCIYLQNRQPTNQQ